MEALDRRAFLLRSGVLALTAPSSFSGMVSYCGAASAPRSCGDWRDLVEPFRKAELEEAFALLAAELRRGARREDLLSAILIAGVRDVRPSPVGFKLHACMVIESARVLSLASPAAETDLPVFFALHDLKVSQALDEQEGGWEMPPPPDVAGVEPEQAAARLEAALKAWDHEEADRAATVLGAQPVTAATFEAYWPSALRDFHNYGHKPIYASQLERMAVRWKEPAAEPLLRALASGLLEEGPDAPELALHEQNVERARKMPERWEAGAEKLDASFALLDALRSATPDRAVEKGLELLASGVAPASLWIGIALHASEVLLRAPSLLPVHAFTSTHAFRYIARTSQRESTRALALLQALAWAPLYRDALARLNRADSRERKIDDPESKAVAPTSSDRGAALETLRRDLLQQMAEHHQLKYAAALLEESKLAPPEASALYLAAAVRYLPRPGGVESSITELAKRAIAG